MPIQVKCKCGKVSVVPDSAAGKTGKCTACQQPIRVPAPKNAVAKTASDTAKKATPIDTKAAAGMDKLFQDAGFGISKGPVCPSCQSPIPAKAAVCVQCGYHFERGEKLAGHAVASAASVEFENERLNDAARNIVRDQEAEARTRFTGSPWWVSLAIVLAIVAVILIGVIRVDATTSGVAEKGTLAGTIQRIPFMTMVALMCMLVSLTIYIMAHFAVVIAAFYDSIAQGMLAFFVPLYSQIYAFMNRKRIGTAASVLLIWTVLYIISSIWFNLTFDPNTPDPVEEF